MAKLAAVIACTSAVLLASSGGLATEPAPVLITVSGPGRIRIEVAEGTTMPCDSSNNRPLWSGYLSPGETYRASIGGECICLRNTRAPFPETDWTTPALACRKRVCKGRVCKPAPDPTIRVSLP